MPSLVEYGRQTKISLIISTQRFRETYIISTIHALCISFNSNDDTLPLNDIENTLLLNQVDGTVHSL